MLWPYFLILVVWYGVYRYRRRNIYEMFSRIKGTLADDLPIVGVAPSLLGSSEAVMKKIVEYSKVASSSGGIVKAWLGPLYYVVITDPKYIEIVLKNHLEKETLHRAMSYLFGNSLVFAPVSIWKPRRKVAAPAFSPKIISGFVNVFAVQSRKLSILLKQKTGTGNFKILPYLTAYNLDAIMETAMGVQLNSKEERDNPILTAVGDAFKYSGERLVHPWLQLDWLFKLFPQYKKLVKAVTIIHDFIDEVILRKKSIRKELNKELPTLRPLDLLHNDNIDFLDVLMCRSGGENGYNNMELREEVVTFIVAAMDTSAATMGFVFKLLGKYPEVQQKVFDELHDVFGDSDRLLEKEDLPKLQFLERVLKETLRLYPSAPFLLRNAMEDCPLNEEIVLPKGTGMTISLFGLHRNPNVWGPDADCFDPDRFLPERLKGMHPCSFIPFGYGPRNCLGYQFAMSSIKTLLSTVLRRYKVFHEPEKNPVPNIRIKFETILKDVEEYEVALELR